jgi:hypothetical protein
MDNKPASEAIHQAKRELNETQSLVEQQYGIIKRLKWFGAETRDAIRLLINLLDLQETRERRLSYLRVRGTGSAANDLGHRYSR